MLELFIMVSLFGLYYCLDRVKFVMGMCGLMKRVSLNWL
jgi:hypothetical protein